MNIMCMLNTILVNRAGQSFLFLVLVKCFYLIYVLFIQNTLIFVLPSNPNV